MFSIILAAAALTCVWVALDLWAGGLRSHEERQS